MQKQFISNFVAIFILFASFVTQAKAADEQDNSKLVYWFIEASIKDGELDNWKAMNKEMVKATKDNEPGTLSYDWAVSDDGKTCYIFEEYADSAAVMIHLDTFGEKFAERLMKTIEIKSFYVFGNPNEEVRKALVPAGAKFVKSVDGFVNRK